MKQGFTALLVGLLFGLGLAIAGMTQPQKVIGFLDFFGNWDPSLMFVMIGAIAVHAVAYRAKKHRVSPLLADTFHIPTKRNIDGKLVIGSALFGIGWGLAGFCPGPAMTSLVTLQPTIFVFVGMMALGMWIHYFYETKLARKKG